MRRYFAYLFTLFLSPLGLVLLAALDSSIGFYLPTAVEAAIVILTARNRELVWLFPVLATVGSTAGAFVTYVIGEKIGEESLKYWVPARRLETVRTKIKEKGALPLATTALLPPPFPLSPFVLACGALGVKRKTFLLAFSVARLVRFGIVAALALLYGRWVLRLMKSSVLEKLAIIFVLIAVAGTAYSIYRLRQNARRHREGGTGPPSQSGVNLSHG